jgi:hypothetical protein
MLLALIAILALVAGIERAGLVPARSTTLA